MNKLGSVLGGVFALFTLGWIVMVAIPFLQLDALEPQVDADTGDVYPVNRSGVVAQGRAVYVANGCVNCHSQQLLPGYADTGIVRQWGTRQNVARDYLYDTTMLAGWNRLGPDLSSIGKRRDDAHWHYRHLYNPRSVSPGSIMPPYSFLFEKRKVAGAVSHDAIAIMKGVLIGQPSYEIVPTDDARALVGYLLSLDRTHPLPEALTEAKEEEKKDAEASGAGDAETAAPAAEETSTEKGAQ